MLKNQPVLLSTSCSSFPNPGLTAQHQRPLIPCLVVHSILTLYPEYQSLKEYPLSMWRLLNSCQILCFWLDLDPSFGTHFQQQRFIDSTTEDMGNTHVHLTENFPTVEHNIILISRLGTHGTHFIRNSFAHLWLIHLMLCASPSLQEPLKLSSIQGIPEGTQVQSFLQQQEIIEQSCCRPWCFQYTE